jgi:hypothetical protein
VSNKVVPITAHPVRATNMAAPHLQAEFIKAARAAMGQPDEYDVMQYLGQRIKITFNHERGSVTGTLTRIVSHPSRVDAPYLILDNDNQSRYALNAIQSIELVDTPELEP